MKITGFQLGLLSVPLKTSFKTALRTVDCIESIVLIIETDTGRKGYGEATPTAVITGDTKGSIIAAISEYLMPVLIGEDIRNLNRCLELTKKALVNNFSAKAAVEIALFDLFAQYHDAPLYQMLGGGPKRLATDITISVDYIDKMVADAQAAVEQGYDCLKIKVGKEYSIDLKRIKAIYSKIKGQALLRLDINQGWTAQQTVDALNHLESIGVELDLIEQPVPAANLSGMKYITQRSNTAVMSDESTFGPAEVIELIQEGAADIINIKLMKTGGISDAIKIANIASVFDVQCMMGCMLEAGISVIAAAHLASAKSSVITRIDLDGPALCQSHPIESDTLFDGPDIVLGDAPGLGIQKVNNLEIIS